MKKEIPSSNPRPEIPIVRVRFHKQEGSYGGVPVLLGLTSVVRRETVDTSEIAALRDRFDAAVRSQDENAVVQAAWAWGLLDPTAVAPWAQIGEIKERRGDARGAVEAYRKSLEVEWNQPPIMEAVRRLESQVP